MGILSTVTVILSLQSTEHVRIRTHLPQFAAYNQQDATFHNLFISVRCSTCFRWVFCPSSGAQNCTYSIMYLSDQYCYLLLAWPVMHGHMNV